MLLPISYSLYLIIKTEYKESNDFDGCALTRYVHLRVRIIKTPG